MNFVKKYLLFVLAIGFVTPMLPMEKKDKPTDFFEKIYEVKGKNKPHDYLFFYKEEQKKELSKGEIENIGIGNMSLEDILRLSSCSKEKKIDNFASGMVNGYKRYKNKEYEKAAREFLKKRDHKTDKTFFALVPLTHCSTEVIDEYLKDYKKNKCIYHCKENSL